MRNPLAFLAALLLIFAGCPGQKPAPEQYEVISLAMDSEEHIFSGEYQIYAEVENSTIGPNSSLIFVISDNGRRFAEIPLGGGNASENASANDSLNVSINDSANTPFNTSANASTNASINSSFSIPWVATSVGPHIINATIEEANGTLRATPKILSLEVSPIGNFKERTAAGNVPIDSQVWCAQKFHINSSVPVSEAQLRLISLVPTRKELFLTLEIHNSSSFLNSSLVESVKISSGEVVARSEWHTFKLKGKTYPPGDYWVLLKRGDDTGNLAWELSLNGEGAQCITQSGGWASRPGMFFFLIK